MALKKEYAFFSCLQKKKKKRYMNILGIPKSVMYKEKITEGNQGSKKFNRITNTDVIVACPGFIEDIKRGRKKFCDF